jgi:hypothetical protein
VAFPITSVIDDFNRASLGGNWSEMTDADGPLAIYSSTILGGAPATNYCGSYWNVATYGPDCEAYITYTGAGLTGEYFGLWIRAQGPGAANIDGYKVTYSDVGGGSLSLIKVTNFTTEVTLDSLAAVPTSGHKIGIQAVGDLITGWRDTGGGWTQILDATDSTYAGAGHIVIDLFDIGSDTARLDNFGGGTISGVDNTTKPSLPGSFDPELNSRMWF